MLLPLQMKKVRLMVTADDAPEAALLLARLGVFETDSGEGYEGSLPELPAELYRVQVREAVAHLDKILHFLDKELPPASELPPPPDMGQVETSGAFLAQQWAACSQMEEQQRMLQEEDKRIRQLEMSLESFSNLEIDLGLLNAEHTFLDIRVGTVPLENVERLGQALGLADYRLEVFHTELGVAHTLIAGPTENYTQIARALDAAAWRPQTVPDEFAGYPEQVRSDLEADREPIREALQQLAQQREQMWQRLQPPLAEASTLLQSAAPFAQLGGELRGRGALTLLLGWVPARELERLEEELERKFAGRYLLSSRDPAPVERDEVPTALRHRRWLAPFAALVENYGMPRYGELDPTVLFALTFVAMFGMMFGDVGHGLTIALTALVLRKRLGSALSFLLLCGASSTLFGLLYGSVFGYEELIHPLWISPLSDPVLMLTVALGAGIGLISMATLLTVRNRLVEGRVLEAITGGKGLAGLLLYGGLCLLGYRLFQGEAVDGWLQWTLGIAAFSILATIWSENGESGLAERLLITVVEGFDTLMGYISGTLSFLRISAFSLNHVALAIAVFTIANSLDTVGYWVAVVVGNLIIIVLEGAIVMIQALRLEYYEGFSRFLSGSGHAFSPLRLQQPINRVNQTTRTSP